MNAFQELFFKNQLQTPKRLFLGQYVKRFGRNMQHVELALRLEKHKRNAMKMV